MRSILLAVIFGGAILLFSSCRKSASPWNFNTAITAAFNGQTNNYVAPAGVVNAPPYEINSYQAASINNTLQINLADSPYTRVDSFSTKVGNSLVIVNDGVTYTTAYSTANNGTINMTVNGHSVTGTFSGILQSTAGSTLSVTNGTINTSY